MRCPTRVRVGVVVILQPCGGWDAGSILAPGLFCDDRREKRKVPGENLIREVARSGTSTSDRGSILAPGPSCVGKHCEPQKPEEDQTHNIIMPPGSRFLGSNRFGPAGANHSDAD